jgi:hypothetical protein
MKHAMCAFLLDFPTLFSIVNPISGALIVRKFTTIPRQQHARLAGQVAF